MLTMIKTEEQKLQDALADVRHAIMRDEARLQGLKQDLGDALAGARLKERGADKRVSSLSMDVVKLQASIGSLRTEESALIHRLDALTASADGEAFAALQQEARDTAAEAQQLEAELAAMMRKVIPMGIRLNNLTYKMNKQNMQLGANYPAVGVRPYTSGWFFSLSALKHGERYVDMWLQRARKFTHTTDREVA